MWGYGQSSQGKQGSASSSAALYSAHQQAPSSSAGGRGSSSHLADSASSSTPAASGGGYGVGRWARGWGRAIGDSAQGITERWQGKPSPVENDPLSDQRRELNEYMIICSGLQKVISSLASLMDNLALQKQPAEDLVKTVSLAEFAGSPELQETTQRNFDAWRLVSSHYDPSKGRLQQSSFELKNRATSIHAAQKQFESRDRKYRKMIEDDKKLEKARDSSRTEAATLEKLKDKAAKSKYEFEDGTQTLSDELNHILAGRQRFLQETSRFIVDLQAEFVGKASLALNEITSTNHHYASSSLIRARNSRSTSAGVGSGSAPPSPLPIAQDQHHRGVAIAFDPPSSDPSLGVCHSTRSAAKVNDYYVADHVAGGRSREAPRRGESLDSAADDDEEEDAQNDFEGGGSGAESLQRSFVNII